MEINKLVSLNPREVKPISLSKASKEYLEYVYSHFDTRYIYGDKRLKLLEQRNYEAIGIKDFKTWLSTEI